MLLCVGFLCCFSGGFFFWGVVCLFFICFAFRFINYFYYYYYLLFNLLIIYELNYAHDTFLLMDISAREIPRASLLRYQSQTNCSPVEHVKREREMFYLTTHSTHFIYGYMASDIWLRTSLIVRRETRCRHIGSKGSFICTIPQTE